MPNSSYSLLSTTYASIPEGVTPAPSELSLLPQVSSMTMDQGTELSSSYVDCPPPPEEVLKTESETTSSNENSKLNRLSLTISSFASNDILLSPTDVPSQNDFTTLNQSKSQFDTNIRNQLLEDNISMCNCLSERDRQHKNCCHFPQSSNDENDEQKGENDDESNDDSYYYTNSIDQTLETLLGNQRITSLSGKQESRSASLDSLAKTHESLNDCQYGAKYRLSPVLFHYNHMNEKDKLASNITTIVTLPRLETIPTGSEPPTESTNEKKKKTEDKDNSSIAPQSTNNDMGALNAGVLDDSFSDHSFSNFNPLLEDSRHESGSTSRLRQRLSVKRHSSLSSAHSDDTDHVLFTKDTILSHCIHSFNSSGMPYFPSFPCDLHDACSVLLYGVHSASSPYLIFGTQDGYLELWDPVTHALLWSKKLQGPIHCVQYSRCSYPLLSLNTIKDAFEKLLLQNLTLSDIQNDSVTSIREIEISNVSSTETSQNLVKTILQSPPVAGMDMMNHIYQSKQEAKKNEESINDSSTSPMEPVELFLSPRDFNQTTSPSDHNENVFVFSSQMDSTTLFPHVTEESDSEDGSDEGPNSFPSSMEDSDYPLYHSDYFSDKLPTIPGSYDEPSVLHEISPRGKPHCTTPTAPDDCTCDSVRDSTLRSNSIASSKVYTLSSYDLIWISRVLIVGYGSHSLVCIDCMNGEIIWEYNKLQDAADKIFLHSLHLSDNQCILRIIVITKETYVHVLTWCPSSNLFTKDELSMSIEITTPPEIKKEILAESKHLYKEIMAPPLNNVTYRLLPIGHIQLAWTSDIALDNAMLEATLISYTDRDILSIYTLQGEKLSEYRYPIDLNFFLKEIHNERFHDIFRTELSDRSNSNLRSSINKTFVCSFLFFAAMY